LSGLSQKIFPKIFFSYLTAFWGSKTFIDLQIDAFFPLLTNYGRNSISTVAGIIREFVGCHGLALVLYVIDYMHWSLVDVISNICEEN